MDCYVLLPHAIFAYFLFLIDKLKFDQLLPQEILKSGLFLLYIQRIEQFCNIYQ